MPSHRRSNFAVALVALASIIGPGTGAGCKSGADDAAAGQAEADRQAAGFRDRAKWDEQPTGVTPQPVAVAQGTTPLVHLFDIGGPIRVVDLTTQSTLAAATVPDRTLVRVDDRNGVTVGKDKLFPGPLPAGRTYAIYLDPATPNVMRQGIGSPGDAPR